MRELGQKLDGLRKIDRDREVADALQNGGYLRHGAAFAPFSHQ
jgi:hypothetical protein